MKNCAALVKAIDAYLAKTDENLIDALDEAGFVEPEETVKDANVLEERIAEALVEETEHIRARLRQAVDLDDFAKNIWPEAQAGDGVDAHLEEIFYNEFAEQMPKLANAYIKQIDTELVVETITRRTTDWARLWSRELGQKMKLTSHQEIERLLVKNLEAGASVATFTQDLMDSGIRNEYFRARRAALTEMLRAHSVAQQEAIAQNPAVSQKMWRHTGARFSVPRDNHVKMDESLVNKDQPFTLEGADGKTYYPMYPRDPILPPGESINCHCIHQGIADEKVLGLSLEDRKRLQQQAIDEDDGEWEKELDAKNRARAGIE